MVRRVLDGDTAIVVLDEHAAGNLLSPATIAALAAGVGEADGDHGVRSIVLTHTGHVFSGGADLGDGDPDAKASPLAALVSLVDALSRARKPLVARVDGAVRGGALCLLASCDVVLASEESDFATPEVRLGMPPTLVAPVLAARLGSTAARRFVLSGGVVSAREACELGLVTACVRRSELDARLAAELEGLRLAAPGAQAAAKELLRAGAERGWRDAEELVELTERLAVAVEIDEGLAAFRERRRPGWAAPPSAVPEEET